MNTRKMTSKSLASFEKVKRQNFNRKFGKCYGIKLLELQTHNLQGQCFADIDFLFRPRMTAEEIGMMCENIAAWIGGELHGTVNIDYSGKPSLSIVVELS